MHLRSSSSAIAGSSWVPRFLDRDHVLVELAANEQLRPYQIYNMADGTVTVSLQSWRRQTADKRGQAQTSLWSQPVDGTL